MTKAPQNPAKLRKTGISGGDEKCAECAECAECWGMPACCPQCVAPLASGAVVSCTDVSLGLVGLPLKSTSNHPAKAPTSVP